MSALKTYYHLTKPGIIYGNAITAIAGFVVASRHHFSIPAFIGMLAGLCLVMASGCVSNNYLDRDIDQKMARTKNRALVRHTVSNRAALIFAAALGIMGIIILLILTNPLTAAIAAIGWVAYVIAYTPSKRRTVHSTVIGSISGAVPPVVGYTAAANRLDSGALILFLILVFWQMPHFYAIAMYRAKDYAAAGLPVLPAKKGVRVAKIQILIYVAAFTAAAALLSVFGYAGLLYRVIMIIVGATWLGFGVRGFRRPDDARWARQMFFISLIVIMAFSIIIPLDAILRAIT